MMDMRRHYKQKSFGFGNPRESRFIRADQHQKSRKNQRGKSFLKNRNLNESTSSSTYDTESKGNVQTRNSKLLKWKAERDRRKRMEQANKKPIFKVGVVHHKFYSPVNESKSTDKMSKHMQREIPAKKVTRATQKRLLAKLEAVKKETQTTKNLLHIKAQKTPIVCLTKLSNGDLKQRESFAPANYKFKAPENLVQVPMFGRVAVGKTPMEKFLKMDVFQNSIPRQSGIFSEKQGCTSTTFEKGKFGDQLVHNKPPDKIQQTQPGLSIELSRIDSSYFDHLNVDAKINFGKKLNRESYSLDKEDNLFLHATKKNKLKVFKQEVSANTASEENTFRATAPEYNFISPVVSMKRKGSNSPVVRVLRSRTFANVTPKDNRQLMNGTDNDFSNQKQNGAAKIERRRSSRRSLITNKDNNQIQKDVDLIVLPKNEMCGTRKSVRKSVKFTDTDCTGSGSTKHVYSLTPYSKHSEQPKISLLGKTEEDVAPHLNGDLISFDSPKEVTARGKRMSRKIK